MRREDIENAILSTFLGINEVNENLEDVYKLDLSVFTSPFRKRVAEKINNIQDDAYGFLSYEIEEACEGTVSAFDYSEMNGQNYLGLKYSKKYHDKLIADSLMDDLC